MFVKKLIQNFWPFVKYCIVGFSGTFIDIGFLYLLVEFANLNTLLAATLSFTLAASNNFILNKIWTFQNKSKNYRKQYVKFLIISLVGLGITLTTIYILGTLLQVWYIAAKVLSIGIVVTWNFLGNKIWTFKISNNQIQIPHNFHFELTIVIPAYNESNRIKTTLLAIDDFIKHNQINAEIIVVSDGCTDETPQIVQDYTKKISQLKLRAYKKNQGKGHAVKVGINNAQGKFILIADADNSTPIEDYHKLKQALHDNEADIAIGSRYLAKSAVKKKQPLYRIALGRVGNILIRLFLIEGIKDTQCGFKLFTHRAAQEIFHFQKVRRFGFDMEALVVGKNLGFNIIEVPVNWFNSAESRFRPIKDALITFKDLIYIKLNLWSGRYAPEEISIKD